MNAAGGPPGARRPSRRAVERAVPVIRLIRSYRREWLAGDLLAGVAVCVLSIPMSLACSGMIGVEAHRGFVAAVIGLFAYAFLTRSRSVVVGPDTSVSIVVATALAGVASGADVGRVASLAALVAILAGVIMILMGVARLGAVADFLSRPVLVGFMNGAALIIVYSQLGKLLGLDIAGRTFLEVMREIAARMGEVRWGIAGGAIVAVLIVVLLSRAYPRAPWTLIVFLAGLAASFAFDLESRGLAVVGAIPRALPVPQLPDVTLDDVAALIPAAISVAFLTFPEAILLARAFGGSRSGPVESNRELIAIGVANILSGATLSFSIAASSTRTSLSRAVGANTQAAHVFAAVFLCVALLFLGPVVAKLPIVALAVILVYAGIRLLDMATVVALWRASAKSGIVAILTTLVVLLVGIVPGILVGVFLSIGLVIHQVSRPPDAVLRKVEGRNGMHDVGAEQGGELVQGLLAYRFYAPLIFSNVNWFSERIRTLVDSADPPVRAVLLDAQAISDLDVTAAEQIRELILGLAERGVSFMVANANRPLRERFERYGLSDLIGTKSLNRSVNSALKAFVGVES